MVLSLLSPAAVKAAEEPLAFESESNYAIVEVESGKAIDVKAPGWTTHTTAAGIYIEDGNKVESKSLMKITTQEDQSGLAEDEVKVLITSIGLGDTYPLRAEEGNDYVFADADKRNDQYEYIITKIGNGQGVIRDTNKNWYIGIDNGELRRVSDVGSAATFWFIENPEVTDFSMYIEHKETGNYVRANGVGALLVDGAKTDEMIGDDLRWTAIWGDYNGSSVTFVSRENPQLSWQGGNTDEVKLINRGSWGGWESIRIVPGGDGTISFKDTEDGRFFTVSNGKITKTNSTQGSDENGKFVIHCVLAPEKATGVMVSKVDESALTVEWQEVRETICTGYKVVATPEVLSGKAEVDSGETNATSIRLEGLEPGTVYNVKVLTVNGESPSAVSEAVSVQTKNGPRPVQATNLHAVSEDGKIRLTWDAVDGADSYEVYRAESAYAEYTKTGSTAAAEYIDENLNEKGKYYNYYKVVAVNVNGESELSDTYTSLETELFGTNTIIFAPTDETARIDEVIEALFNQQNDFAADAQFKGGQYQVYFKPGDYTQTQCMNLGFYTSFSGLGQTPYDVKLNNIAIPAYLPAGELGNDTDTNATCNFWRGAENLSIINTGNPQGKARNGTWRENEFNWAVAQAAPLRRIYCERNTSYDWNYGWASGGYVADSIFTGNVGTLSGQQFYTRNSEILGQAFGTTLNNFYQGVNAGNLPNATNGGDPLINGNGYSNWSKAAQDENQQVFTNILTTPKISEKPFLYLDQDGEYKVFVPSLQENTSGVSWSEGYMGEGDSIPLSEFYIAHPQDSAKTINEQLSAGKSIYFTPGTYHAEEVIQVNNANTILLGTGMASIIPDNESAAMVVADVANVKVVGLIFDAGAYSADLLKVGEKGAHNNHSNQPIILQDLFFRIGGTTDTLTTADNALVINSDNVIGDHFWIWRADHGAGVSWYGNAVKSGLIVNGDNVTCYALFNEHHVEYDTLWNGENGSTYFYQNEKCYDPISQDAWMSHNDTVNGYASYKVANGIKNHYAVGLGIYNVFIYTGPTYDSTEVQIQMDNAIEVPNSQNVIIENACIQTFADEDKVLQKFNHIVNGVGDGVSSGIDSVTGEVGDGWSRKFLISYQNGTAVVGKPTKSIRDSGKFLGLDILGNVKALGDDDLNVEEMLSAVASAKTLQKSDYSEQSWAVFEKALQEAEQALTKESLKFAFRSEFESTKEALKTAVDKLAEKDTNPDVTVTPPTKVDMSQVSVSKIASQVYTGKAIIPALKLTYKGTTLAKDRDYTVSFSGNTNVGTAKVIIKGKGNFQGTVSTTFTIIIKKGKTYTVGNLKYKVTNANTSGKGTVTVVGVKSKSLKTTNIKDTVKIGGKTFKITAIGDSAFKDCKKLTKVTIGKNVKTIGAKAFYNCKRLKNIVIKSTVLNKVGKQALQGIFRTAKIKVPNRKLTAYQKLLSKKGQKSTVKITK